MNSMDSVGPPSVPQRLAAPTQAECSNALPPPGGTSFADTLSSSIDEVARLQSAGETAVEDLATGRTQDVDRVVTQVDMADMAFQMLLSIRAKLMEAYNEIKNLPL